MICTYSNVSRYRANAFILEEGRQEIFSIKGGILHLGQSLSL